MDRQGRLVVPAELRHKLGAKPGEELLAWVEEGRLVVAPRAAVLASLPGLLPRAQPGRSLVDDLLADRRLEAALEEAESSGDQRRIAAARQAISDAGAIPAVERGLDTPLSEHESQILRELAGGATTKEIAHNLSLSASAVKGHLERLIERLEAPGTPRPSSRGISRNAPTADEPRRQRP
jgi:DNA-binding CsgD family transcriptional regulator/bifunctional DNA-binding transcriptional regulator/antitoxin component of YhaV-PrlF toxin-antitoxin module